jgi:modulator of FtsH protease
MSMMDRTVTTSQQSALATNKVLRNTYTLLSLTLLFSAACAGIAVMTNMPPMGIVITLVGYFGLLFLTTRFCPDRFHGAHTGPDNQYVPVDSQR